MRDITKTLSQEVSWLVYSFPPLIAGRCRCNIPQGRELVEDHSFIQAALAWMDGHSKNSISRCPSLEICSHSAPLICIWACTLPTVCSRSKTQLCRCRLELVIMLDLAGAHLFTCPKQLLKPGKTHPPRTEFSSVSERESLNLSFSACCSFVLCCQRKCIAGWIVLF